MRVDEFRHEADPTKRLFSISGATKGITPEIPALIHIFYWKIRIFAMAHLLQQAGIRKGRALGAALDQVQRRRAALAARPEAFRVLML
jgi:hypothetical protein